MKVSPMKQGTDFCPGQFVANMTVHTQTNHTGQPLLFHLGRDPGEKYQIKPNSGEYRKAIPSIYAAVHDHFDHLKKGEPQLNWCDRAVMKGDPQLNWCDRAVMVGFTLGFSCYFDHLKKGEPQLNWCDRAVMNWAPPGCKKINACLPIPPSNRKKCYWPH
ncbi:N-acetylgalactosamine-6-sulfatase [Plakobranchus ocellatus]|uniref:N-acetylgalactosamine-6-sulfatase n=1 Tax=Plakobranchus ocellatus TaxID=259542 RepID=A0AAV4CGF5_9GAST|nr:N-acetylgalactosamine-6-sulfatase [Plakobranchus ocellatus]